MSAAAITPSRTRRLHGMAMLERDLRLAVLTDRRADNARSVQMIVIDAAGRALAAGRLPVPLALELAAAIRRAAAAAACTAGAAQPLAVRPRPAQCAPLALVAVKGGAA